MLVKRVSEKKLTPSIRFDNFNDEWFQCELNSIFGNIRNAFVGTATPYYVEKGHFYLESNNVKNGQINRKTEVFINDEFHKKQKDKWLHTGDLVMVQSGHVGHTAVIPEELDGTAAHALIMFSDYKQKTDPYFLNYQFQTMKSKKKLSFITTGNTIKHILSSEMKKYEIELPSYYEQNKIGDLFKQIEKIITLQQQLLNDHKQLKKAMLQKMFPQKGETVPRIRFTGYTDEWEKHKLGDIADFNPRCTLPDQFEYIDLESVVGTELVSHRTEYKDTAPSRAQRLAKQGDIFFQTVRPYQKNNLLYNLTFNDYVFSTGYAQIRPYMDSYFLFSIVQEDNFVLSVLNKCTGTSYPAINSNDLSQIYIPTPKRVEEQEKIGKYFKILDKTINSHQNKLETYQKLKKAMLQKMFV